MGLGFGQKEHALAVRKPRRFYFDCGAKVQDLLITATIDVNKPDLSARGMEIFAVVENMSALQIELGNDIAAALGARQHHMLSCDEIMTVNKCRLGLLRLFKVIVGTIDEPAAVGMELAPTKIIIGAWLSERDHDTRSFNIYAEEPHALVAALVFLDDESCAVGSPGDDKSVLRRLGQA